MSQLTQVRNLFGILFITLFTLGLLEDWINLGLRISAVAPYSRSSGLFALGFLCAGGYIVITITIEYTG